jgi:hypothetical protein
MREGGTQRGKKEEKRKEKKEKEIKLNYTTLCFNPTK